MTTCRTGSRRTAAIEKDAADELLFSNNSSIRVGVSMRSGTLQYLHISEYGQVCARFPEKAREIRTGALNTVQAGQDGLYREHGRRPGGALLRFVRGGQDEATSRQTALLDGFQILLLSVVARARIRDRSRGRADPGRLPPATSRSWRRRRASPSRPRRELGTSRKPRRSLAT